MPVGFTAYATELGDIHYSNDATVKFEGVLTNLGQHYDTSSSTFTCPYRGVYFFSLEYVSYKWDYNHLRIMKNDNILVKSSAQTVNRAYYNHGSAFVITECEPGDKVSIVSGIENHIHVGEKDTTFSGYLLHRYFDDFGM